MSSRLRRERIHLYHRVPLIVNGMRVTTAFLFITVMLNRCPKEKLYLSFFFAAAGRRVLISAMRKRNKRMVLCLSLFVCLAGYSCVFDLTDCTTRGCGRLPETLAESGLFFGIPAAVFSSFCPGFGLQKKIEGKRFSFWTIYFGWRSSCFLSMFRVDASMKWMRNYNRWFECAHHASEPSIYVKVE